MKYATSNERLLEELQRCSNVVTKNTLEKILLGRCNRGDEQAGIILFNWLKGWTK